MELTKKHSALKKYLEGLEEVVIAFSGGVDSTFLLKTAHDVLGTRVLAVTTHSSSFPEREIKEARAFCEKEGILHVVCPSNELALKEYQQNSACRCYICKKEIFKKIWEIAQLHGIAHVAEGSNMDDFKDDRPGLAAIRELNVLSPLQHAQLSKEEIRALSRDMGLPTWDKPSFACLASRFPYGEPITAKRLAMVEQAEQVLQDFGFVQLRVRFHGTVARIETDSKGFALLADPLLREKVYGAFRKIGFSYTALDLLGYRTGSLNEIKQEQIRE